MLEAWTRAVKKAGSDPVALLKALLIPLAYLFGRWAYHREMWEENKKMWDAYDKIDARPLEDEDVDEILDKGKL